MRAAGDQLRDFRVVVDVREAEAHFAVRHDVEQVETFCGRCDTRLDDAVDPGLPRFCVGPKRLFLDGRQAAIGVARREACVAQRRVIARSLGNAFLERACQFGSRGTRRHQVFHPDQFACFLEDRRGARLDEQVEGDAHRGIGGEAGRRVRSTADGADDELGYLHRHGALRSERRQRRIHPRPTGGNGLARAARVLDTECRHGTAGGRDRALQLALVEALAAQRHQQRRTDVRMRAQPFHHRQRVVVRIAAWKPDQVHVAIDITVGDFARHVMRAFDQVRDDQHVANALAAVTADVAAQSHVAVLTHWWTPTLAAVAAPLPPAGAQLAPWGGPAALMSAAYRLGGSRSRRCACARIRLERYPALPNRSDSCT